ncbi:hypothetical protein [Geodermatophilus africanus]|nr:hypothetical protein [Geodermatophilus africanus]
MSATTTTPAGWARTALPWGWLASAALTGLLGYLLFAVSDHPEERTARGACCWASPSSVSSPWP